MFRRFLHHFFWDFYDHLGGYLAQGALIAAALFAPMLGAGFLASVLPDGWMRVVVLLAGVAVSLVLLAGGVAGTFMFADTAARQEAARFARFREGVREHWRLFLKGVLAALLAFSVAAANVAFYSHLARGGASTGARAALLVTSMVFLWLALGVAIYSLPFFAGLARYGAGVWASTRKSFILFALAPMYWVLVFVFVALLSALCVVSVAGIIFLVPIAASASTTALALVVRHAEFLGRAREEIGEGKAVGAYRRRALELGWEWEAGQPKRTLRELIKPWEM